MINDLNFSTRRERFCVYLMRNGFHEIWSTNVIGRSHYGGSTKLTLRFGVYESRIGDRECLDVKLTKNISFDLAAKAPYVFEGAVVKYATVGEVLLA